MNIKRREKKNQNKLLFDNFEIEKTDEPIANNKDEYNEAKDQNKSQFQFSYKNKHRQDSLLTKKPCLSSDQKQDKAKKTFLNKKFCESKPRQDDTESKLKELDTEVEALTKPNKSSQFVTEKENDQIENIIELQQKTIKENEEKPFWIGGIIEVDIPMETRLANIETCDTLIDTELQDKIVNILQNTKTVTIPSENFVALGSIWAKPKKVFKKEKRDRKQILKTYLDKFKKRKRKK